MNETTSNIDEQLNVKQEYFALAKELYGRLIKSSDLPSEKLVIAIGGESGSGKSTTAICLAKEFVDMGMNCSMLHMDSYFNLPPQDNHNNRIKSLENVGPQEVNLKLLNQHIVSFIKGEEKITIPVVNYKLNSFSYKDLDLSQLQVLIVEGVYSFQLENVHHKIFLSRTYKDTLQNRLKRTRENHNPLIESILEIEHKIVNPMIDEADAIIEKNYTIR